VAKQNRYTTKSSAHVLDLDEHLRTVKLEKFLNYRNIPVATVSLLTRLDVQEKKQNKCAWPLHILLFSNASVADWVGKVRLGYVTLQVRQWTTSIG